MADNVAVTAGSGTTIAADEVTDGTLGSVKVQYVKFMDGTLDGTAKAKVVAASTPSVNTDPALVVQIRPDSFLTPGSAVSANSAPVVIASDQGWPVSTTGFMKKEDVASADGDAGIPALAVRKATAANTSGTDGDYEFLQVSAGALWVNAPATAISIAKAEDAASADADVGVPAMAVRKGTPANTSGSDGDYEMLQVSAGTLWVNTPATAASFAKIEDAASADADVGVPAMMRRTLAPVNTSGTDGDYEMIQGTGGRLWVDPQTRFIVAATSGAITRPANTTAYTALDAISNNATAGSVTTNSFAMSAVNDDPVTVEEILMFSTDTGIGGKTIRVYLYNSDPTANSGVGAGDNAAWSQKQAGFIGTCIGTMIAASDGSHGRLIPEAGARIVTTPTSGAKTIFWMLQALEAFTPSANSTTFTPTAKGFQGHA